ncbi:uncharacterized protein LOC127282268 [Leptopilina boulardi]|uniref:uncharacterized protein LOC127282268 n=1 Tax=Leptopilina boulardi TaxID=63433 RepID=UPI0021F5FD0A|nr:uncharacterized protein LOC127282268 [Leptopilina boulardi]
MPKEYKYSSSSDDESVEFLKKQIKKYKSMLKAEKLNGSSSKTHDNQSEEEVEPLKINKKTPRRKQIEAYEELKNLIKKNETFELIQETGPVIHPPMVSKENVAKTP